jgi:2-polyprenyl-6-methoxyphenol hydroxylase-like FAD-dependent oxidoreductase
MNSSPEFSSDILIVGAGPAGMYLALRLQQLGLHCTLVEKHVQRLDASRSIGIHPPSFALMQKIGLQDAFETKICKVSKGEVLHYKKHLGILQFAQLNHPKPFIGTLSQNQTESILEEHCLAHGIPLHKGFALAQLYEEQDSIFTSFYNEEDKLTRTFKSKLVIGADGVNSSCRKLSTVPFLRKDLPDFYAMADFDRPTNDPPVARLYLHPGGIVESFPLPNQQRRWICRFNQEVEFDNAQGIADCVLERTAQSVKANEARWFSKFRPYVVQSATYHKKRVVLIGDAAQAVSPIGGQGMNLGWLQGELLARCLAKAQHEKKELSYYLPFYAKQAKIIGQNALKQSLRNTWMGRSGWFGLKKGMARILTSPLLSDQSAKVFSMQWLETQMNKAIADDLV